MEKTFSGKKIMVFGASSGIGRQIALSLGQMGVKLVLSGRNEERLRETALGIEGEAPLILPCDASDFNAAQNIVKEAVKLDGTKLDGCVFSAGIGANNSIASASEAKMLSMFQTNFFSLVAILKAFSSRRVSNDGASFVSLSSRAALIPDKGNGLYSATKAAVSAYTVSAAKELCARKIRVNAVCPELVTTPMVGNIGEKVSEEWLRRTYPLGLLAPEDVADAVIFLLSPYSKKITGQSIWLSAGNDGGCIEGYY